MILHSYESSLCRGYNKLNGISQSLFVFEMLFFFVRGGRERPVRRKSPGRRARETLARLAKIEHRLSPKLKSIGRRLTHHMKARRVRIPVSITEIPNRA